MTRELSIALLRDMVHSYPHSLPILWDLATVLVESTCDSRLSKEQCELREDLARELRSLERDWQLEHQGLGVLRSNPKRSGSVYKRGKQRNGT